MKRNPRVMSSRQKCYKAHFMAPSSVCRQLMSMMLSSKLLHKYNVRSIPICKDDEVQVVCCTYKGHEGNVVQVYRRHSVIHVERITRDKVNNSMVNIIIHRSKVVFTKIKLDKDFKALLDCKAHGHATDKANGKFTADDMAAAAGGSAATGALLQEID